MGIAEGFIDLEQIDIIELQAGPLQHLARRRDRLLEHYDRIACRNRQRMDARDRRKDETLERPFVDDQRGRRAIGHLAGVGGGDRSTDLDRLDRRYALGRRVTAYALVLIEGAAIGERYGGEFFRECPSIDGARGLAMAVQREGIHRLAGETIFVGDHLGAGELAELRDVVAASDGVA